MIRKPLARIPRTLLGIVSFCALIGGYTLLSNAQYQKNPTQVAVPGWTNSQQITVIEDKLQSAKAQLEQAESAGDAEAIESAESDISRLELALKKIQDGSFEKSIWGGVRKILDQEDDEAGLSDFVVSLKRFAQGMSLGIALAFLTGIAMGCFTPVEAFLKPPVAFLASIPPTAMMAVYMLIFKLKPELFIAVVGIGIFPVLAQAIFQAVKNDVPESSVNKAYTLGASNFEVIWEVVIPQILPRIIDAIRLQIGPAMVFLIAVEWAVGSEGVGYRLRLSPKFSNFNVIYLYLIILGIFGMLVDWAMIALRRWWCPWFEGSS